MYAALARAVLDEAGRRPRGVGGRAAAPAPSARLEGRAGRAADPRAALQCAAAGALLTGPAAFFRSDAVRRRPGLAGRGAEPARARAGRRSTAGRPPRADGPPAWPRPRAPGSDRSSCGRGSSACSAGRAPRRSAARTALGALAGGRARLRSGHRDRALREAGVSRRPVFSRRSAAPGDEPGRRRRHRRRRADRLRARGGARGAEACASSSSSATSPGPRPPGAAAGMLVSADRRARAVSVLRPRAGEPRALYPAWSRRLFERRRASTSAIAGRAAARRLRRARPSASEARVRRLAAGAGSVASRSVRATSLDPRKLAAAARARSPRRSCSSRTRRSSIRAA